MGCNDHSGPDGGIDSVVKAAYAWDDAGNLTSVKDVPDAANGGRPADRQCYQYDWARRLTQAWTPSNGDCAASPTSSTALGGGAPYWNTYSYDAIGNRTKAVTRTPAVTGSAASSTTSTYTYPTSGAGVKRPHAVTGVTATGTKAGASSFTYDNAGNMTRRAMAGQATQALSWDAEGELAGVASDQNGDGTVSAAETADGDTYVYTADGERLVRHQDGEQGSTTTVYLPGGQELVLDKGTGQAKATRYYAIGGKTIAMRVGMLTDQIITIVPDHHNTGQAQITHLTSTVTRKYTDPFGVERGAADAGGGWSGDHGFLDKPLDATGLTAVGARMYDTVLGRFITVDPVMDLNDPQQWNAYSYANNTPTTQSDPDGLDPRPIHERGDDGESCAGFGHNNCGGGGSSGGGPGGCGSMCSPSGPSVPSADIPTDDGTWEYHRRIYDSPSVQPVHTVGYTVMAGMFSPQTEQALGAAAWVSPFADASQLGLYLACIQKGCTVYENAGESAALTAVGFVPGGDILKHGDEAADIADDVVPLFKAPQRGLGQGQFDNGYRPEDFPGDGAFFAREREISDSYAVHYGDGVIETRVPRGIYDETFAKHEMKYLGTPPGTELAIPSEKLDLLSSFERTWHQ